MPNTVLSLIYALPLNHRLSLIFSEEIAKKFKLIRSFFIGNFKKILFMEDLAISF